MLQEQYQGVGVLLPPKNQLSYEAALLSLEFWHVLDACICPITF